jgi:NTE family protein
VDHVRAGQTLSNGSPVSLILKGRCALPQPDAVLRPGDTIRERRANGDGGRSAIRAMVDSAVLRLSRDTLRRLSDRWSVGALATHRRPGPGIVRRVDEETRGGKIVCLMPLSEGLPCADFARSLAATIAEETSQSVLCLQVEGADVAKNGSPAAVPGHPGVFRQLVGGGGRDGRWVENLARKLERGREQFPHVIVEVARAANVEAFREVLHRCAAAYPMLRQNGESLFELNLLVREAVAQGLETIPIKPLVYLEPGENAHGLGRYIETTVKRPVHFYLRAAGEGNDARLRANLRRLGREICGRQVGLALSSGAARGLAHIGVIQVLEENGIEVDFVAGSSMGAYIAAVWGTGHDGCEMEKFARELEGYRGIWRLMDLAILPQRGFLLTKRVRRRLAQTIGEVHFSDLVRPVRVVATRLDTLERVIFSGGSVVDAVLASIAIPGVCVPVTLDGVTYFDGGICDPLPVDVLTGMGIRKIIAVNTIATPETLRACKMEMAELERRRRQRLGGRVNSAVNLFAVGNAFDTLMRSLHAAQTRLAEISCGKADVILRPYTCESRWHDFGNPLRYIRLGREEAEAQMSAIRALIDSPHHENQPTHHVLAHAA